MNTVDILRDVRDLLAEEKRWTQRAWAREPDGSERDPDSIYACCWCIGGAFWKVTGDEGIGTSELPWEAEVLEAWRLVERAGGEKSVFDLNDHHTHAEVLAALDQAIAAASAKEEGRP